MMRPLPVLGPRSSVLGREILVFVFFIAAAIALTWPMARNIRTAVPDPGDPLLNAWIIDWDCYALTHSPMHLFDAPIYHPAKYPLAYSENMLGIALIGLPFYLAGVAPLTLYNILVLLGFAHAGYGAYVLGRLVTRSTPASIVAGIFFAFTAFKFDHLSHIQIIWSGWLPLLLAALLAYWQQPSLRRAALISAAFLMNGLTNIHFLLFASVAVVLTIVLLMIARSNWHAFAGAVGAIAVASALLVPILLPYRTISHLYGAKRLLHEVREGSATWDDWLRVTSRNRLYGAVEDPELGRTERQLFPGLLALGLTLYALLTSPRKDNPRPEARGPRPVFKALDILIVLLAIAVWMGAVAKKFVLKPRGFTLIDIDNAASVTLIVIVLIVVRLSIRLPHAFGGSEGRKLSDAIRESRFPLELWAAALWIVIGVLGSLGLNAFFHTFLFRQVEAFSAVRAAARWAIIAYTGLVPWTAAGAAELIARRHRPRSRQLVAVLLLVAAFIDCAALSRYEQIVPDAPPFYRWLNRERVGPLLELPMHNETYHEFYYLLYSTLHHVTSMNGTSGWEPPNHLRLRARIESGAMDETFTRALENYGCKLVVIHPDLLSSMKLAVLRWASAETAAGRLAFLRRFESGMSGDYALAVTKNLPEWPRYVDNMWDRLGIQPAENFRRMLRGQTTYNSATFAHLETPKPYEPDTGTLQVSGWALSPNGIRSVTVLVHGGSRRYAAASYPRPDVSRLFPWYPNVPQPGFIAKLRKRPKGVPRQTDVQVEIVDGAGRVTRLPDVPIYWD